MWDVFLAYAGPDAEDARALHDALKADLTVFLDTESLSGATRWVSTIPEAQRASRSTVAVVSANSGAAYYQQEEIAEAIHLERRDPERHRVIPVYPNGRPENVPYGFRLKTGYDYATHGGVQDVAACIVRELVDERPRLPRIEAGPEVAHPLRCFPRGPMVDPTLVHRSLPRSYAALIRTSEAQSVIAEAAAFRRSADPRDDRVTVVEGFHLPPPQSVSPHEFWLAAFSEARLHGPRMLAALLLVVPDDQFEEATRVARSELLRVLVG